MLKSGFINRLPLSVKMAGSMLLVVAAVFLIVQWFESRQLEDFFVKYQLDIHEKNAQEQLHRFVNLLIERKNSVKALVAQKNFNDYVEHLEKNNWTEKNNEKIFEYSSPPEWFPSKSVTRAFYHHVYVILIDPRGRVREIYKDIEKPLPKYLRHPEQIRILPRLINRDSIITYIEDEPFQLVIQPVYNKSQQLRLTLMFAFPINDHFIRESQGAILGNNELALIDADNRVMTSSNPDIIPKGITINELGGKYYISKKTFFEYGEAEIEMMFISLIPKAAVAVLTQKMLGLEFKHIIIYGITFIFSSTLVVFLLAGKIKNLTNKSLDFIQLHFGRQYSADSGGDELFTLERSFHRMMDEIVAYQNRLSMEKERLAVTLGSIGDAVIATDLEGIIVLLNKIAEELTGWNQQEAVGRPLTEVFHIVNEITRERCENPVEKILKTGMIVGLANHTALIAKDGTVRVIADSGAPIRDRENNVIGMVLVFRDITEKQKMEEELLKAKKLESIGMFAAGIAHEINNPLANAYMGVHILKKKLKDNIPWQNIIHKFESIEKNMERAALIAKELLEFSRQSDPQFMPLNINDKITDSLMFMEHKLKNVTIHKKMPEIPVVWGDPMKLEQVFINVFNNAVEAMQESGEIFILTSHRDSNIEVKISDTGPGIPDDIISRVFDPFFTTKEVGTGTGLGLSICYGIISLHKGTINITNSAGNGSTVIITLPVMTQI